MHRNFDLVVTILSELRDADTASLTQAEIETAIQASLPGETSTVVGHHLDILADAGLIARSIAADAGLQNTPWRLTWKGHDALDQQDDDEDEDEDDAGQDD